MTNSIFQKSRWKQCILAFVAGTALAVFFATKSYYDMLAVGVKSSWLRQAEWQFVEWYGWALLSPFMIWLCLALRQTGRWRQIPGHMAAGAVFTGLHVAIVTSGAWMEALPAYTGLNWPKLFNELLWASVQEDAMIYAGFVSLWYALEYHRRFREREVQVCELETHLAKARLQALKMQLHPHFLFNTLNGIASLIYEDPRSANRMLARLGDLLRMTLEEGSRQEGSLRRELEFNRRYLELEQIRLGERLTVNWQIAPETLDASVPNLLLQPLVENAIRHGIAPYSTRGEITIHAQRNNDTLDLRVTDNGPGLTAGRNGATGTGVGLRNTRARLQQLYGDAHRLDVKNGERGGFTVEVTLPFCPVERPDGWFDAEHENSNTDR